MKILKWIEKQKNTFTKLMMKEIKMNEKQKINFARLMIYPFPLLFLGVTIWVIVFRGAPLYVILIGLAYSGGIIGGIELTAAKNYKKPETKNTEEIKPVQNSDDNIKRNINEITLEKQNYISLLELVEKYKALEKQKDIEIPIEEDETLNIGGYTYMKK